MRKVPLTKGKVALVDDEDFERVSQFKWCAIPRTHNANKWYGQRSIGQESTIFLHRFILNLEAGDPRVDHRDGDGLNCQKANLRIATNAQNMWNHGPYKSNACGFKGVSFSSDKPLPRPWVAGIQVNGRRFRLGYFATAEEAARAYDAAAREHHGEFAFLNFPNEGD